MTGIWDLPGIGFGDCWAGLSYLLHKGTPQTVSRFGGRKHETVDLKPKLEEMLDLFDTPLRITVSDEHPNTSMHMHCWAGKRWPCRLHWEKSKHKRPIAYQFDGVSSAGLKNPPQKDIDHFLNSVNALRVGLPLPISGCATVLANSDAFVGVCSGMAHLAHSVGVPVFLLQYELDVSWWHGDNPITVCHGMDDVLERLSK